MSETVTETKDNAITDNGDEFLQKFGYRSYEGGRKGRFRRIFDLINFEVRTTWDRSTFGKILLIITLVLNIGVIISTAAVTQAVGGGTETQIKNGLYQLAANYLAFTDNPVQTTVGDISFINEIQIGILLIALFGIAGSGFFADDKEGKVVEIYLSRLDKSEYIIGKVGAIVVYTNLFLMIPLLATEILSAQSYRVNHLDYLVIYLEVILFSFIAALILGLGVLCLSIIVEKRHYASLGFFLIFLLSSTFGTQIFYLDPSNELLLLISPEVFLSLLAYVCFGHYNLGFEKIEFGGQVYPLNLHDGTGLEYWHVWLVALGYLLVLGSFLSYKIRKLTTEEL
jgi:hypothetical protein